MKILFTADQHITLRKTKVPKEWAIARYRAYFKALREIDHCVLILGGDWFDKSPNIGELGLFIEFIKSHPAPIYMISGNHEASSKYDTFLKSLKELESPLFKLCLDTSGVLHSIRDEDISIQFFNYTDIKAGIEPPAKPTKKSILVSHARGTLPFVEAEYDFNRFKDYDLVLLGDLHNYHQHKPFTNVWYPGSPYSINFEQNNEDKEFGILLVDTEKENWQTPKFIPLNLPQLVKRVVSPDSIDKLPHNKDNLYIYEVEGTIEELSKVTSEKAIVKKVVVKNKATIDLFNKTKEEELKAVLDYMRVIDSDSIISLYTRLKHDN